MEGFQPPVPPPPLPPAVLPYATPLAAGPSDLILREGSVLIVPREVSLPDLCVKCNAPAAGWRLRKTLSWHSPWVALLILVNLIVYLVVALVLQKRAKVEMGLCPVHRAKRRNAILIVWLLVMAGFGMIVGAIMWGTEARYGDYRPLWLGLAGGLVLIFDLVYGTLFARTLTPKRIDDRFAWLKGCGEDFLANFPPAYRP